MKASAAPPLRIETPNTTESGPVSKQYEEPLVPGWLARESAQIIYLPDVTALLIMIRRMEVTRSRYRHKLQVPAPLFVASTPKVMMMIIIIIPPPTSEVDKKPQNIPAAPNNLQSYNNNSDS